MLQYKKRDAQNWRPSDGMLLPNLSNLEPVALLPENSELPPLKIKYNDDANFNIDAEFRNFQNNRVFSCINGTISVSDRAIDSEADFIFDTFANVTIPANNAKGGFNRTAKVTADVLDGRINAYATKKSPRGEAIDTVLLRMSNVDVVAKEVKEIQANMENIDLFKYDPGTLEYSIDRMVECMFQEVYVSLYAAKYGIGPQVYAVGMVMSIFEDEEYPRLIYLMEAGKYDLINFCRSNQGWPVMRSAPEKLFALMERASEKRLLMLDIKLENLIMMNNGEIRAIDFDASFTTISFKAKPDCILLAMCILLLINVMTKYHQMQGLAGSNTCVLPILNYVAQFTQQQLKKLKDEKDAYDGLCWLMINEVVPNKPSFTLGPGETLLEDYNPQRIVDRMIVAASHYSYNGDPINNNRPLLQLKPFNRRQPFLKQLAKNAIAYFKENGGGGRPPPRAPPPAPPPSPRTPRAPPPPPRPSLRGSEDVEMDYVGSDVSRKKRRTTELPVFIRKQLNQLQ